MAAIETSPATRPGHVHRIVTLLQQSDAKTETNNDDAAGGCTNRCTSFAVEVLARGTIRDLKKQLSRMSGVPVENLLILDIFNGSVYNEFNDRDPVQHIRVCMLRHQAAIPIAPLPSRLKRRSVCVCGVSTARQRLDTNLWLGCRTKTARWRLSSPLRLTILSGHTWLSTSEKKSKSANACQP